MPFNVAKSYSKVNINSLCLGYPEMLAIEEMIRNSTQVSCLRLAHCDNWLFYVTR